MRDLQITLPTSYGVASYPPGASFGPRVMQDWEFVWLIQGSAEYRWGEQVAAAPEGAVVLCRPGASDSFQWDRKHRTRHAFFHFQMASPPEGWQEWPLVRAPVDDDLLLSLFRSLLTWLEAGDPEQCLAAVSTMVAAFRTGQRTTRPLPPESWPPAVEIACAAIFSRLSADPAQSISLGELAGIACVTPEYLCRLFKSTLHTSPSETVRLVRLDRAATLLTRSNYAVGEIAALCGFANPFHFSRAFRAAYGLPPTEFRRRAEVGDSVPVPRLTQVFESI